MSVRVVARVRPLLKAEVERDQIVGVHNGPDGKPTLVKIPNPKNHAEEFGFQFNSVYGQESTQQEIFDAEVSPTVKHLFQGYDVTIFAYGSTGTGKTHTMRGGKSMVDRGMIPRLLSSIYRKGRAVEKAGNGGTTVDVLMSYYEIYNDRVFDLFEPPEKRTATGLPIREAEGGKTVVVGLTEAPCGSLKEFEVLYDKANANRSTGATKLNAHSSRSHAILCVKVTVSNETETRISTACAIDLAGSEDNRRTGNGKDRMVESASINKSLFVLAQCVEAISKKQSRIPYRESKMTRILSLGQNNGFTVMILNLAPVKAFHLDTLSSLNFANRTKKIEVREIENEPMFKGPPRPLSQSNTGSDVQRQPLRALTNNINVNMTMSRDLKTDKPAKLFSVYADKSRTISASTAAQRLAAPKSSPFKRPADNTVLSTRPQKQSRPAPSAPFVRRVPPSGNNISAAHIESLVERKVSQILAQQALSTSVPLSKEPAISAEVQARLDSIERRLEGQEGERAEGLSYLFMAKQHQARGEEWSALKMYELAVPFFDNNEKLQHKIEKLRRKLAERRNHEQGADEEADANDDVHETSEKHNPKAKSAAKRSKKKPTRPDEDDDADGSYYEPDHHEAQNNSDGEYRDYGDSDSDGRRARQKAHGKKSGCSNGKSSSSKPSKKGYHHVNTTGEFYHATSHGVLDEAPTPRTKQLLDILNSRESKQIQKLNGLGAKKAELIVAHLNNTLGGRRGRSSSSHYNSNGVDRGVHGDPLNDDHNDDDQYVDADVDQLRIGAELLGQTSLLTSWNDVLALDIRGIGMKSWEVVRDGLAATV